MIFHNFQLIFQLSATLFVNTAILRIDMFIGPSLFQQSGAEIFTFCLATETGEIQTTCELLDSHLLLTLLIQECRHFKLGKIGQGILCDRS